MENAHFNHEDDDDDDDSLGGSRRKKAESLAAWLVETKPEKPEDRSKDEGKKPESVWSQLGRPLEEKPKESNQPATEAVLEVSEEEAPLEDLSQDEVLYIERQIVRSELAAEPADPAVDNDPAEEAVYAFRHKVIQGLSTDEALNDTLQEIDSQYQIEEVAADEQPEAQEITENEGEIYLAHTDDEENDDHTATAATVSASTAAAASAVSTGGGASGSSGGHTVGGAGVGGAGGIGGGGTPPPYGPATFGPMGNAPTPPGVVLAGPTSVNPNNLQPQEYRIDGSPFGNLLIGGIVGYLIGRRRGRIKTEKRLLPIQKKLEKKVENLQQDLAAKEERIRKVIRQRDDAQTARFKHPEVRLNEPARMPEPSRNAAVEANQLHSKLPAEKIGLLVATEAISLANPETRTSKAGTNEVAKPDKVSVEKHVETLDRRDLLELSEKVIIEATTLRQLYETHLISEKGLRRLMTEHLRGGDIKRQLRRELIERQIDYERDPILRDRTPMDSVKNPGSVALKQMFKRVDQLSSTEAKEELAIYKARAAHKTAETVRQKHQRRMVDIALVTLITVLSIAVAIMSLTRH